MDNTGRILEPLKPSARRILFGATADQSIDSDLNHMVEVDRAHLVMLLDCGLVDRAAVCRVLAVIDKLRASGFAPLRGRAAPRGLYLLYEDYLIERLGPDTGGVLQTARSRNDLNATVLRLRLRNPYTKLLGVMLRLQAILLLRARQYAEIVMPGYTHFQVAVPITYGHYLGGIAQAVDRDIGAALAISSAVNDSPLGACALGGTTLPIDPGRTADLLGFERPLPHSLDAVASRDLVLRLLAGAAVFGVTLSRVATDLLLWASDEFGFITLGDAMVGSSSIMPQKRNPFLLEHIQGRSASPVGAFAAAVTAMHGTPFTNSVAVGTEAVSHLWRSLEDITAATTLLTLVVAHASPKDDAMLARARYGCSCAVEMANQLMVHERLPFRSAHRAIGSMIRAAMHDGLSVDDTARKVLADRLGDRSMACLDPHHVARSACYGGGPGGNALDACLTSLRGQWKAHRQRLRAMKLRWHAAQSRLEVTVRRLLCGPVIAPND
jgi:argininosuccinate lyase